MASGLMRMNSGFGELPALLLAVDSEKLNMNMAQDDSPMQLETQLSPFTAPADDFGSDEYSQGNASAGSTDEILSNSTFEATSVKAETRKVSGPGTVEPAPAKAVANTPGVALPTLSAGVTKAKGKKGGRKMDQNLRRRQQNREASARHRARQKHREAEVDRLAEENEKLRQTVSSMASEMAVMRVMLSKGNEEQQAATMQWVLKNFTLKKKVSMKTWGHCVRGLISLKRMGGKEPC